MNSDRYQFTVHTYGCKVNTYDTGLLQKRMLARGHDLVDAKLMSETAQFGLGPRTPRVHILNTCAVTGEATKDAAKAVRRLKAKDPFSTVVITGCGAQVDGETFDKLAGADLVVANSHKGDLENILDRHFRGELETHVFRSNIFRKDDLEAGGGNEREHTRSFLKIQDGCNSFCTYCVIPFARGKSRSIPVSDLVQRISEMQAQGTREVVLTGVHIGDYEDGDLLLHDLVRAVLEKTTIERIRLSSLEPVELTDQLLALYHLSDRLCRHFHMSIQSANTKVLSLMKRRYTAEDVESALLRIAKSVPGAFVGMDVIVGFPGEGEQEFADTYERLERLPWTRIHVFPYSERPGTKAASYSDVVPRTERALRSQRLRDLSAVRMNELGKRQIDSRKQVLLLQSPGKSSDGLSRDYWPVRISEADSETARSQRGNEIEIEIVGFEPPSNGRMDGVLLGRPVSEARL
jgi:threonylcarbamoyladenosine tRNA methylthiotransferase MtaB